MKVKLSAIEILMNQIYDGMRQQDEALALADELAAMLVKASNSIGPCRPCPYCLRRARDYQAKRKEMSDGR